MKPINVTVKADGKFDVQVLKSMQRQGVAEYTHMYDMNAADVKTLLEEFKLRKEKELTFISEKINSDLAEVTNLLQTYFPV